jgi:hypothetical protein
MTDQERAQVLKMIEEGKISPEEGLRLMQTLEQNPVEDEPTFDEAETAAGPAVSSPDASAEKETAGSEQSIQEVAEKGRRLWFIPLGVGIAITLLGGMILYWNIHPTGASAWAYCLGLPVLFVGVAIMALGAASRTARWLFVHVRQKSGEHPRRIMLGFPLPLGLAAWFLRTFGHFIPNLEKTAADEMIVALENTTSSDSPLVVNVDEGEDGEKVQVYIG